MKRALSVLAVLALLAPVVVGPFLACNAAKDVAATAHIIECINANIDLAPETIVLRCGLQNGPEVISLIEGQKALHARAKPCTIITVDAGPPRGPGI